MFVGVTEHKNTLGLVCMALGLGLLWRFLLAYRDREDVRRKKRMMVYGVVIAMLIWLFVQANSVTAQSCLILGSAFLFLSVTRFIRKERWRSYLLVAALVMAPFATLFLGVGGSALQGMGRDATLTGRTEIWKDVLSMSGNPLTGVGFESFWLGQRADRMWRMFYFHPTQAHNGYIEIYLELGWIGIALLAAVAIAGCRNAVRTLRWDPMTARMRLAYIVIGLAYNMTEAGFRMMTLTWFFFLLSVVVVPKVTKEKKVPTILEPSATTAPGWEWNELQPQDTAPGLIGRSLEAF
jgi:O-antigen ligase